MRVGDRTDFNRLHILIETNGTIAPREALEQSIEVMISQLKSIIGFQEEAPIIASVEEVVEELVDTEVTEEKTPIKAKLEDMNIPARVITLLSEAGIRTSGGLARKTATSLKEIDGIGDKAVEEISVALSAIDLSLKGE